jgi:5-oxoprolinase (ATP-hydrolysing)
MDCAILASHRKVRPFGAEGGEAGELGRTFVRRTNGIVEELQGCDQTVLQPGEAVTVVTPTGGGWGRA